MTWILAWQDKRWHNLGHVQNDADGQPLFLHRTDAKFSLGADNEVVYITTPIGPETYKRYHYDRGVRVVRVLEEASAHDRLNCTNMDSKTVAILHEHNSKWYFFHLPAS